MPRQIVLHVMFYFGMTVFAVCALAVNIVNWFLGLLPKSRRIEKTVRRELHLLMRLWMRFVGLIGCIHVEWPDIDKLRGMKGTVVVANHPNLLDICWILAASPDVACVVKSSIRRNNFFNASARAAGYISNDSGMDGLHEAVDRLRAGELLAVFPEGTRTCTPPANPFKPGFALIARQSGAPIQTLYIRSNTKCFTKGVFFRPGTLPIRYELRLGPQFNPAGKGASARLAREVETAMRSDLESGRLRN